MSKNSTNLTWQLATVTVTESEGPRWSLFRLSCRSSRRFLDDGARGRDARIENCRQRLATHTDLLCRSSVDRENERRLFRAVCPNHAEGLPRRNLSAIAADYPSELIAEGFSFH